MASVLGNCLTCYQPTIFFNRKVRHKLKYHSTTSGYGTPLLWGFVGISFHALFATVDSLICGSVFRSIQFGYLQKARLSPPRQRSYKLQDRWSPSTRACHTSGMTRSRGRRWSLTITWPVRSFALSFSIKSKCPQTYCKNTSIIHKRIIVII